MSPLTTFLLWMGYFALHSLLAADAVKAAIGRAVPAALRGYRLVYNGLALVLLGGLLYRFWLEPADYWYVPDVMARVSGMLLAGGGLVLGLLALRHYDLGEFSGWQQLRNTETTQKPDILNISGTNAWVRHPLYAGILLFVAGLALLFPTGHFWAIAASIFVYVPVGIYWEEIKLRRRFGPAYDDYCRRVKRLIPGVW